MTNKDKLLLYKYAGINPHVLPPDSYRRKFMEQVYGDLSDPASAKGVEFYSSPPTVPAPGGLKWDNDPFNSLTAQMPYVGDANLHRAEIVKDLDLLDKLRDGSEKPGPGQWKSVAFNNPNTPLEERPNALGSGQYNTPARWQQPSLATPYSELVPSELKGDKVPNELGKLPHYTRKEWRGMTPDYRAATIAARDARSLDASRRMELANENSLGSTTLGAGRDWFLHPNADTPERRRSRHAHANSLFDSQDSWDGTYHKTRLDPKKSPFWRRDNPYAYLAASLGGLSLYGLYNYLTKDDEEEEEEEEVVA